MSTIFITAVHKCRCCVHLLEHLPPLISQSVNSDSIYIKHVGHVTINFTNCFLNDKISESQMSWQICVWAHKSVIFVMIASAEVYIQDIYSTKCNFFSLFSIHESSARYYSRKKTGTRIFHYYWCLLLLCSQHCIVMELQMTFYVIKFTIVFKYSHLFLSFFISFEYERRRRWWCQWNGYS